jgi:hypothetical protein
MRNPRLLLFLLLLSLERLEVKAQATYNCSENAWDVTVPVHKPMYSGHKNGKAASTGSRLIAEVNGDYSPTGKWKADSTVYFYSGSRGGDYESLASYESIATLQYDSSVSYTYDTSLNIYRKARRSEMIYDATGKQIVQVQQILKGSAWENDLRTQRSYYSSGKYDTQVVQQYNTSLGAWVNLSRTLPVCNSNNEPVLTEYQNWNSSANSFQPYQLTTFTFSGNVWTRQLIQFWDASSSTYINGYRISYYYDINSNLTSYTSQMWASPGGWANRDSMVYVANGVQPTEFIYNWWDAVKSKWYKRGHRAYSWNAMNKRITQLHELWDTSGHVYSFKERDTITYNTSNQITSYNLYASPSGAQAIPLNTRHYYYEAYSASGLTALQPSKISLTIAPIPASDHIELSIRSNATARSLSFGIYDAPGRRLASWQDPVAKHYTKQVAVSNYAAGSYWLVVSGEGILQTLPFVVAH